jgi:hypothetical protein
MATKTKKTETKKATKATKPAKAKAVAKGDGKMSQIEAAIKVLAEARKPMNCKAMVEAMAAKKYWSSPNGKTPAATLYAAILRDVTTKGKEARFKKVERGQFALNR